MLGIHKMFQKNELESNNTDEEIDSKEESRSCCFEYDEELQETLENFNIESIDQITINQINQLDTNFAAKIIKNESLTNLSDELKESLYEQANLLIEMTGGSLISKYRDSNISERLNNNYENCKSRCQAANSKEERKLCKYQCKLDLYEETLQQIKRINCLNEEKSEKCNDKKEKTISKLNEKIDTIKKKINKINQKTQ